MDEVDLKKRTKQFGLRVIKLVESLPNISKARTIGHQLLRSGLSVGANYRAACRGRSKAEFIAKAGISLEEADELVAIFTASIKTARSNLKGRGKNGKSTITNQKSPILNPQSATSSAEGLRRTCTCA